jgi:hypothetical protein
MGEVPALDGVTLDVADKATAGPSEGDSDL